MKKYLFLSSALLGSLVAPAFAATPATDAPAEAPAAEAPEKLTEVVVSATKRSTNLQKTPIAISVLSAQSLADRHVESLLDLADGAAPSLRVATFEARQSALTVGIRGIVPFDQNQTARDTPVGVYIDNIYMGRSQGLNAALFDVQRIEILRGPQGTLFGRNTEGGAVSIVTKDPTGVFGGRVQAGFGNYGSKSLEAHLDLPAFDTLAFKIDSVYQHQDPTVKNILPGQAGWNQYDRTGGRLSAKWTPNDKLTGVFSIDASRDESTPNYSQLINYNPLNLTVGTATGNIAPLPSSVVVSGGNRMKRADIGVPQQPSVALTEGAAATFTYHLTPSLDLKSITGYRRVTTDQWDNSGGAHRTPAFAANAAFSRYSLSFLRQHQVSQEFQLIGKTDDIDYVAGIYYFNEHVSEWAATPSTNTWNADGTYTINSQNYTGPVTSSKMGWANKSQMFIARDSVGEATSEAAFGQATWTPSTNKALHLTLGGRVTNDKRTGALTMISNVATPYTLNFKKTRFDPLAIAAYDVTPDAHVYVKYATGYRAGGANDRSTDFRAFGPESVKSYEVGAKLDMFDHKARLNLAAYKMDRENAQLDDSNVDPNPTLPGTTTVNPNFNKNIEFTYNAPTVQKIEGLEAELLVKPTDNLTLGLNYAYTKVPPINSKNNAGVVTTFYTVFTPKNAASVNIDYKKPFGSNGARFEAHLDGNYADAQYTFQNESVMSDSSFIVNGRLAIADIAMQATGTKMTVSLWSRNLLDETYIYRRSAANAKTLGDYGNFNPPRTVGLEVTVAY
ncbi:TonB-dependent receptor [Asticcacaulis sp.]|uniref:TonB-dependent receptor n=1 Tax=Asticcacaulis sp. TaxID=1872648 RepID=UPI0031E1850D